MLNQLRVRFGRAICETNPLVQLIVTRPRPRPAGDISKSVQAEARSNIDDLVAFVFVSMSWKLGHLGLYGASPTAAILS